MSHRRSYSSKYSTYKRYVTSTEVSYGSHTARSSYKREAATEYSNAQGTKSTTKEYVSGSETHSLPVYMAIQDFTPEASDKDSMALEQGQIVEVLDNKNPTAWLVRTKARPPRTGWVPGSYFETPTEYYKQRRNTREITGADMDLSQQEEALIKRDTVYQELLSTEEEFVNELRHVIENYVKVFEDPTTPDAVRHLKDQLTLNLRELYNFHANVLLKGLQYYADDPGKVSQTFVRLERDFDHHVKYCGDVTEAEKLLLNPEISEFFDQISSQVESGGKKFVDYLQLPRQRLQQYQQYFKEFVKYSSRAELNTRSLQRALELMLSIPQRANDLLYIRNIQQYPGDVVKLGRLLRHEKFYVWEGEKEGDGRKLYVFLFKARIVLSQLVEPEDPEDLPDFRHVATVRLDKYDITESTVDEDVFVLTPQDPTQPTFLMKPADASAAEYARQAWVKEIKETKETLVAEEEEDMETETMTEFIDLSDVRSEFSEYSTTSRKSSMITGPEEGPPRKKTKSPPAISPSASSQSLYSGSSGEFTGTATTLDMQGTRVTRTAYGFRTLQESSAKMCLKVSGYPLPNITWFKEDVQLHQDERHTFYEDDEGFFSMTIDPVKVDDTGKYTCVATNEYGKASTSAFFRVMKMEKEPESPKFMSELKDCEIIEGQSAMFECEVEGWPEPECVWLVDGQVLHPSHDFNIVYDGQKTTLEIKDAQPEDSGVYAVRISNELGVKESMATLDVQASPDQNKVAPEFQQTIDDVTCWEGETAKFKSVLTGDPLPEVTWFVNGVPLTESEYVKMILEDGICMTTIKNITKHFDGEITCRAINRLGETSCTAQLTVRSKPAPPNFVKPLSDKEATENDSVAFEAAVTGTPDPDITWFLNERKLDSSDAGVNISFKDGGICRLQLDGVQLENAGDVVCKAQSVEGEAETKATLTVVPVAVEETDKPAEPVEQEIAAEEIVEVQAAEPISEAPPQQQPKFLKDLKDAAVAEGDTAEFEVQVEGEPDVQWFVNDEPVTAGVSDKGNGIHVLTVPSAKISGTVKCVAKNEAGTAESKAKLTVSKPPKTPEFTAALQDQNVKEGEPIVYEAKVDGEPAPKLAWYLNGNELEDGQDGIKISDDGKRLEIPAAKPGHAGEITCQASNPSGSAESSANIAVKPKTQAPKFTKGLSDKSANEGDTLSFEVAVEADPTPKLSWFFNGNLLEDGQDGVKISSDGTKVEIPGVKASQSGEIECKAENAVGSAETSAKVVVASTSEPPKFTKPLSDTAVTEGTKVRFEATVTGKPKPDITWTLNGTEIKSGNGIKLSESNGKVQFEIASVSTTSSGEVCCKAVNSAGSADTKAKLTVNLKTVKPKFESKLSDQTVMEGETVTAKVAVSGQPAPEITWLLNGKELASGDGVKITEVPGGSEITITAATPEMSGPLVCKAKNSDGTAESKAKLTVEKKPDPPTITKELTDLMTDEKESISFDVEFTGDDLQVTWKLKGTELKPSAVSIETTASKSTLSIPSASIDQSGVLTCTVKNSSGTAETSANVAIVKKKSHAKPLFQSPLAPINLNAGDTLKTKILISGDPAPKVKWSINDRIVVQTEDTEFSEEDGVYVLTIHGASTDMTGTIKCVAYNKMGEATTTAPIKVIAPIPVEFEQSLSDATCREGDTLKLKAVLLGEPAPDVTWYINDKKLEQTSKIKITVDRNAYTVVIQDITCDYSGVVLCKAVNEFGEATSSAKLIVLPRGTPPDFTEWLSNVSVREGSPVEHRVVFSGDPKPVLTWYINTTKIEESKEISIHTEGNVCTLLIKHFSSEHVGEVICTAENDAGEVSCTAQMNMREVSEVAVAEPMDFDEEGTDIDVSMEEEPVRVPTPIMAPKFITKIKDTHVKKGQKAVFECVVPESKGVVVKWLKDGKEIEIIARIRVTSSAKDGKLVQQLVIDDAATEDEGVYTCLVSNEAGEERCTAQLEVVAAEFKPRFEKELESATVTVHSAVELKCVVVGEPKPDIRWFKDDNQITADKMHKIQSLDDGTQVLQISDTLAADAGEYKVEASNSAGKATTEAKLSVTEGEEKPSFTKGLKSVSVKKGDTAVMECGVSGKPQPSVKWTKDGEPVAIDGDHIKEEVSPDGTTKLTVTDANENDIGNYGCEVQNPLGSAKSEGDLDVNEQPSISKPLKKATVKKGETVEMECGVRGLPQPTVKWFKDGQEVTPDGTHVVVESLPDGTQKLKISNAKSEDVGVYQCVAANKAGKADTSAPLEVQTAPVFTKELEEAQVFEGENTVLQCALESTEPKPEIQWFKDDKQVVPDNQHILIERLDDGTQKLTIQVARSEDVGVYKCEAVNEVGKAETHAPLKVQHAEQKEEHVPEEKAPEFVKQLHEAQVTEGESIALECALASSTTKPEIHWSKDDKEVVPDGQHILIEKLDDGRQKLTIQVARSEDIGVYKCEAVNKVGKAETHAPLKVQHAEQKEEHVHEEKAPEFVKQLHEAQVTEGESIALECALASSTTKPEIHWSKDDKEVVPDGQHILIEELDDGRQKLTIQVARSEDIGVYKCEAVNKVGKAETHAPLKVQHAEQKEEHVHEEKAPEFVKQLHEAQVTEGESIALECALAESASKPEIHWKKDGKEVVPDGQHILIEQLADGTQKLVIQMAKSEDIGMYKCEAINKAGKSETAAPLKVQHAEEKEEHVHEEKAPQFVKPLDQCFVQVGESVALECVVASGSKPEIHWLKDGVEIKPDGEHFLIESMDDGTQRLVIQLAKSEDVGTYKCEAINKAGKADTEGKMDLKFATQQEEPMDVETAGEVGATGIPDAEMAVVETAPEFVKVLHSCDVSDEADAFLECKVVGTPTPTIEWFKDQDPVVPDGDKITVESLPDGTQRMTIKQAHQSDIGEYRCVAENEAGTAWTEAPVTIKFAPQFIIPLEATTTVDDGELLTIMCQVTGKPEPEVQWQFNSEPMDLDNPMLWIETYPDGTKRLTLPIAEKEENEGVYSCTATNAAGSITTSGRVVIEGAQAEPEFIVPLESMTVPEGELLTLMCQVTGSPEPVIQWIYNGLPIFEHDPSLWLEKYPEGVYRLTLPIAEIEHAGKYGCKASNTAGGAETSCQIVIQAEASEELGASEGIAPDFLEPMHSVDTVSGKTVTLECKVAGEPAPEIKWFKDGEQIIPDGKQLQEQSQPDGTQKLTLQNVTPNDIGEYRCEATNPLGTTWSDATLGVRDEANAAPQFVIPLEATTTVEDGELLTIMCQVSGTPAPEVEWFFNNESMDLDNPMLWIETYPDGTKRLTLPIAEKDENEGQYSCKATNAAGSATTSGQVVIQGAQAAPEFIIPLESTTVPEGELLTLMCQVTGSPEPVIEWMYNGEPIFEHDPSLWLEKYPEGVYRMTLPIAEVEHAGEYGCKASNTAGGARTSCKVVIQAAPAEEEEEVVAMEVVPSEEAAPEETTPEFVKELQPCNVTEGQPAAFECQVSGQPPPDVCWYRDGRELGAADGVDIKSSADGTQRLVIPETKAEDQGNYRCEATNNAGMSNTKAPLTVSVPEEMEVVEAKQVAPTFIQPLRPCKCEEGAQAAFECAIAGNVEKVVWLKGDQPVEDSAHVKIESLPDGRQKLTVKDATLDDVGNYFCVASNPAGEAKTDADLSVSKTIKLPAFKKQLNSEEVTVGATIELQCQADVANIGEMPDVTWMKDGKEIFESKRIQIETNSKDGTCKLTINQSVEKDTGKYVCLLTNKVGKAKTEGNVLVKPIKPPKFKEGLGNQSVPEGNKIKLYVEVEGKPRDIKFYKGNKLLDPTKDPRIKLEQLGDGTCELTIDGATEDDAGKYSAEATNDGGTTKSEGQVAVTVPKPELLKGLTSQSVLVGEDCKFEAEVSGGKPKSVKWYRNGRELKSGGRVKQSATDNKYRLDISKAEVEDAGTFKVVFENPGGITESEASLTVKQVLALKKGLEDQTVTEGQSVSMAIQVSGKPKTIKWFKNGRELKSGERVRLREDESTGRYSADISGVTTDVEADYQVQLTDDDDNVITSECRLTVKLEETPPKFVIPLHGAMVTEGKTATFEVKIRGKPEPTLNWLKDSETLELSERVTVESMGDGRYRLTIVDAQMTDAGAYSCVATNSAGSEQCDAGLRVQPGKAKAKPPEERYKPSFNVPLHDRRIPEGQLMAVECHADAKPKADIKWTRDGAVIESDDRIQIKNTPDGRCRLEIKDFGTDDTGIYKCIATNELGHSSTQATLSAEVPREDEKEKFLGQAPRFSRELSDKNVRTGGPVTLECQVIAFPEANIQWFKDGIPVKLDSRVKAEVLADGICRLNIYEVVGSDEGAYRCVATNHLGSTNTACFLGVAVEKVEKKKEGDEPHFLKGLTDTWVDRGSDIQLRCQVAGTPRPEIKWYKDGNLLRSGDRMQIEYDLNNNCVLHVKQSTLADEGMYRCEAFNEHGKAKTIATIYIQTMLGVRDKIKLDEGEAPRFTVPLEDTHAMVGSLLELECKVLGQPDPTVKWTKDGGVLTSNDRIIIEPLVDFGRYRLTIKKVTAEDEGTYRCVATNDFGSTTTKSFVLIEGTEKRLPKMESSQVAPKFTGPLSDTRAVEGTPLRMECRLEGLPLPEVSWFKDGERLASNDHVKIETFPDGTARLWIANCTKDDEGLYRIQARNSAGSVQMKATASVRASTKADVGLGRESDFEQGRSPKVVQPLETETIKEGHTLLMACKFSGIPKPTLKWFKDGERIYPFNRFEFKELPDGTVQLSVSQVNNSDGGSYRVVAENDHGTARTTGYITVEAKEKKQVLSIEEEIRKGKAPGFSQPLTVRRVIEGATTMFECTAFGNPFPAIKWLKDGMELYPSDRTLIQDIGDGVQRLVIKDVIQSDDGFYRCVASNPHGTTSTKAELVFESDPERRIKRPKIEDDEEAKESKARFRRGLQNITVQQGTPVEFQVSPTGNPKPTVKWYKNGQELQQGDRTLIFADEWGTHRLVVLNSVPEDEGEYSCEAVNKLGSAKTEGRLSILKPRDPTLFLQQHDVEVSEGPAYPPGFLKQLKNKHSFTGMPAIFDCITSGRPPPSVEWFHNGKKIEQTDRIRVQSCGGGSHALVILRTTIEDMGEYVAVATNASGQASSSCVLDVTVPYLDKMTFDGNFDLSSLIAEEYGSRRVAYAGIPTPPDRGPFIAEVTGHYLTLSWIPTKRAPPRYPQVTYVVEMRELPEREWVMLDYNIPEPVCKVRNLELGKSYQFRVRAENIYGISDPSPPSPPSQLMAPPQPVLDKNKRPLPLLDPYARSAMNKAYGEQYASAPWFAPQSTDKMYCAESETIDIPLWVYGFPDPLLKWTFRGCDIDTTGPTSRFKVKTVGGAQTVLTIRGFSKADAGQYQCFASNDYGDAQQNIFLELAERPNFIQQLVAKTVPCGKPLRLDARIEGNPYPEIKWTKDWHPIVESSRVKIHTEPPYLCSLSINDPILRDSGIYSCTAYNEAGKATSSAALTIEAQPDEYDVEIPRRKVTLTPKKVRESYEVEEEVQKDAVCSIVRVKERKTGRPLLAKCMPLGLRSQLLREIKTHNFLWHPNISPMYDACQDDDGCWLMFENAAGTLLDQMTSSDVVHEDQVAFFIRQLLQALEHLHSKNMAHLDLRPENIVISETNQSQIKLMDFGQSKKLRRGAKVYGTVTSPEFVAPEIVLAKPVSLASDLWSVGVLAYVLLSGISPFHGDSDKHTLENVTQGKWSLSPDQFDKVSDDAKDFLTKVLVIEPRNRLNVVQALLHPWMQEAETKQDKGEVLSTAFLKEFKYRHNWVERRVFVQQNAEEETVSIPLAQLAESMEAAQPLHGITSLGTVPDTARVSFADDEILHDGLEALDRVSRTIHQLGDYSRFMREKELSPPSPSESPLPPLHLIKGERREIEEEIANRILSDISEEGSVASAEDLECAKPFTPTGKRHRALDEPKGRAAAPPADAAVMGAPSGQTPSPAPSARPVPGIRTDDLAKLDPGMSFMDPARDSRPTQRSDRDKTPTQDDVDRDKTPTPADTDPNVKEGAPVVLEGLHQLTVRTRNLDRPVELEIPSESPRKSGKSPVRLSPTKEAIMEVIIAMKHSPKSPEPAKEEVKKEKPKDDEFERLMADVERMKLDFRQRRKEILNGQKELDIDFSRPQMDPDDYDWESQYQTGPETYLLAQRDSALSARIREYRRELWGESASIASFGVLGWRNKDISVRERRRYTDVVKEDPVLQKSASVLDTSMGMQKLGTIRRVRSDIYVPPTPPDALFRREESFPPVFRSRLKETMYTEDGTVILTCHVMGRPRPQITWFHFETPVIADARHKMSYEGEKATLTISPALYSDAGAYSCLAENDEGESSCSTRIKLGDLPERPSRPDVELASDTELFMLWEQPATQGGLEILNYKLEYRRAGEDDWACPWMLVSDVIDEESIVLRHLEPMGIYQFRVTARNVFGWGSPSLSSRIVRTHQRGAPKLNIDVLKSSHLLNVIAMPQRSAVQSAKQLSEIPEDVEEAEQSPAPIDRFSPVNGKSVQLNDTEDPKSRYQLESELFRGRFCIVRNAVDNRSESAAHCVAKIIVSSCATDALAVQEFEALRDVQHENIVHLLNGYIRDGFVLIFMERLYETLLQRFTSHDFYTEDNVARVSGQILSAIQWIHFQGIVHCDLQPDNVMFTGKRTWTLKLTDFGSAVKLQPDKPSRSKTRLNPEFAAPELLSGGVVSPAVDMWGMGMLVFLLMSGFHPFTQDEQTEEELIKATQEDKLDVFLVFNNASQESLRFVTWALKRHANRRMNTEEGLQHRWLATDDVMVRRRENIKFSSNRLRRWTTEYMQKREETQTHNMELVMNYGQQDT